MKTSAWASDIYSRLIKIRWVEEAIASEYPKQEMRCPVHLSIGQEAVAVGISACLDDKDVLFSTHRCHSHYLAKGGALDPMIAELFGKKTGCAGGLGGSMHLIDKNVGMLGASAIVGGSISFSVGAALTFKMSKKNQIAVAFFGDGASEEGVFYESMNFAALKKLPVLFVCENNSIATSSPLSARKAQDNIYRHGEAFNITGERVDGNDVFAVYDAGKRAVDRARNEEGPSLIEGRTYRLMRHVGPEIDKTSGNRTPEELEFWRLKCPIKTFEQRSLKEGLLSQAQQDEIKVKVRGEIESAFKFARSSPFPEAVE